MMTLFFCMNMLIVIESAAAIDDTASQEKLRAVSLKDKSKRNPSLIPSAIDTKVHAATRTEGTEGRGSIRQGKSSPPSRRPSVEALNNTNNSNNASHLSYHRMTSPSSSLVGNARKYNLAATNPTTPTLAGNSNNANTSGNGRRPSVRRPSLEARNGSRPSTQENNNHPNRRPSLEGAAGAYANPSTASSSQVRRSSRMMPENSLEAQGLSI